MTICSACKRVVKIAVQCVCGAMLGVSLLGHGEPHVPERLFQPAPVRIVNVAALVSSSSAAGPPLESLISSP